jgi:ABC-2 type transport system permease protein
MTDARLRQRLRIYALEAGYELVKYYRLPTQLLFSLGFPLMFYAVFGLIFNRGASNGNVYGLRYIALYGAFSTITSALYGFGVGVATERGQGWMLLKRASPMPPEAYFIAKLAVSLLAAAAIIMSLTTLGVSAFGVRVAPLPWLEMTAVLVFGLAPFCALGLAIGFWAGPNSSIAVVNLLSMPMAIVSGLWIPLEVMPGFVQTAARFLPPYHYSQLALRALGQSTLGSVSGHVLVLAGFLALCLALAFAGYRRDHDKTYG